jgi:hypothetical protein
MAHTRTAISVRSFLPEFPAGRHTSRNYNDNTIRYQCVECCTDDTLHHVPPAGEDPLEWLLLTNLPVDTPEQAQEKLSWYLCRWQVENCIEDSIDFFHMDALSSAVAMKVNFDLQLTLMASSLYRLLGQRIGNGYTTAKSRHLFNDFVDASATVELSSNAINVQFQKRAHNPLLLAVGFGETDLRLPWLGGKRLHFCFG